MKTIQSNWAAGVVCSALVRARTRCPRADCSTFAPTSLRDRRRGANEICDFTNVHPLVRTRSSGITSPPSQTQVANPDNSTPGGGKIKGNSSEYRENPDSDSGITPPWRAATDRYSFAKSLLFLEFANPHTSASPLSGMRLIGRGPPFYSPHHEKSRACLLMSRDQNPPIFPTAIRQIGIGTPPNVRTYPRSPA